MTHNINAIFEFGPFRLEVGERRLLRNGKPVPIRGKVFDTLCILLENQNNLVPKEHLMARIWPDSAVEENNLAHNVSALRRALGKTSSGKDHIETIPRQGYRFTVEARKFQREGLFNSLTEENNLRPSSPVSEHQDLDQQDLKQVIRFCSTDDDVRIAYATSGQGPPLVKTANWLNHLEYDWQSPVWRHWLRELSKDYLLVRYDERGNGLSDWNVDDISFEAFVRDLETVIDAVGLERFPLLGISQGCPVSIAYAVRHPERITHLILYGGYASGSFRGGAQEEIDKVEAMLTLMQQGWGRENPAFRQMFTSQFIPEGTQEQIQWFNDLQRMTTSPENAFRLRKTFSEIDVTHLLSKVTVPTIVLHCHDDEVVPFEEGRNLAARIPESRFIALEGRNHLILENESAWPRFLDEIKSFLDSK